MPADRCRPADLEITSPANPRIKQVVALRRRRARAGKRRSYSICARAGQPPRIGVREVPGGALSGWLVHEVRPGDRIEVQPPSGSFTPDLSSPGRHVLITAGSGTTPVLSIAASALADATSEATLLYGNRRAESVMFADEIADLKDSRPMTPRRNQPARRS